MSADILPLPHAHAHNDYLHPQPLRDALARGFTSVEADLWLVDGRLLVARTPQDAVPSRTLAALYLDPLRERVRRNGGTVYPRPGGFQLVVDVKSEPQATYQRLHDVLCDHAEHLTGFTATDVHERAITVVITMKAAHALHDTLAGQHLRYAAYDGRPHQLVRSPRALTPMISDYWFRDFTWTGDGPMPITERDLLHAMAAAARAGGQLLRFWGTPDQPSPQRDAVWTELLRAGAGLINTDDLAGLAGFLRHQAIAR